MPGVPLVVIEIKRIKGKNGLVFAWSFVCQSMLASALSIGRLIVNFVPSFT